MIFLTRFACFLIGWLWLLSCTQHSQSPVPLSKEEDYLKNSQAMLGVTEKFMNEADIEKLHSVAVALQLSRAIVCEDFSGECSAYTQFVRQTIDFTKDGVLSGDEKAALDKTRQELKKAVEKGQEAFKEARGKSLK